MQYHIQTLVKHLFDKDSFEQVTVQELKQFTEAYPFAAVGQYLYAKKLYDARSWNYYEQTEQASLYFHNPMWYRWLMDQKYEAPPVLQRQEDPVLQNGNGFRDRVVVQMPKGISSVTNMPKEEVREPVQEPVGEQEHTAEMETIRLTAGTQENLEDVLPIPAEAAAIQPEEAATHLQEYLPEINTQEPLQADTEAFCFVQADGTPPAEYTETVTENTGEQPEPVQEEPAGETPVYTEEHELTLHEFQPATDAEPMQASTESFGDIQEKEATETYTETVTQNTAEGYQGFTEEPAPAIENLAGIPAAKEETEATPEFFAEAAAAQEATAPEQSAVGSASAVAIAENSLLAEEPQTAESGEWSETTAAPAAYETQETTEAPAAATESPETTETTEFAAAAAIAETPVATEPGSVQENQETDHPVAAPVTENQDDEVQPGGDLPPYQLLDTTTEIPAAEALAENIEHEPTSESVHEGPVNIEFVQDEPVATEIAAQAEQAVEPVFQEEQAGEPATAEADPVHHEPVQEEEFTEQPAPLQQEEPVQHEEAVQHEEPVQQEEPIAEESLATEITAQEEQVVESAVQEPETINAEPAPEESVIEPVAQEQEPVTEPVMQEPEPEQVNHEPEIQQAEPVTEPVTQEPEPEIPTPEPVQWKAEPVFTPANTEPKLAINTEEPIFESYHTIDYFASQGIKLGQEDFKDRLGKQLKSFTEWLRSMKRIVPTEASASLDDVAHQSIQRIAEHSVEEKEVNTEAMAEVWVKQGHPEKAISIYEKLSLLNPAKSTYFAGRIEQLKAL
jgi:hypothetical protein